MPVRTIFVILLFFVLITLPYVQAQLAGGTDLVFGGFLINPGDGNSYLAKMYQGLQGEWRFRLPYSAQPGQGAYLFLFYLFLGHLARLTRLPLILVFHLARLLSALLMVFAVRRFLNASISGIRQPDRSFKTSDGSGSGTQSREFTTPDPVYKSHIDRLFDLALFGLGLGWLVFPFGVIASDLWVAEAYPFLSAYANPHFALGLALMLWLLTFQSGERDKNEALDKLRILRDQRKKEKAAPQCTVRRDFCLSLRNAFCFINRRGLCSGILIGLASLILSIVSPFGVIVVLVVLGGLAAWDLGERLYRMLRGGAGTASGCSSEHDRFTNPLLRWIWVFLFGAPLLLYDIWVARVNPVLAGWNAQNLTPSPPVWDLLLSFSPALLLAMVGVNFLWRSSDRHSRMLLTWTFLGVLLVYLPFSLQRRFMTGLFMPMVGLAGIVLIKLESEKPRLAGILQKVALTLSLPTTLLVLLIGQMAIQARLPLLYLTRGETQAMKWIADNTPKEALILASPETGLFIPAHTGRRVIYGHQYETVNAEAEKQAVTLFFQVSKDNKLFMQEFLSDRGVDYVFFGPRERQLGSLPQMDSLIPVFNADGVEVYQYLR